MLTFRATKGIRVIIENEMASEIRDVELEYTGGRFSLKSITAGGKGSTKVLPSGDSSLTVSFDDGSGNKYRQTIGVYFDGNMRGKIRVQILSDGTLNSSSDIRI